MTAEVHAVDHGWIWVCRWCSTCSGADPYPTEQDAADEATNHDVMRHEHHDFDWADELKYAREERIR